MRWTNPYVLGFLILLLETIISLTLAFWVTVPSLFVLSTVAGYLFSLKQNLRVPIIERLKATGTYLGLVVLVVITGMNIAGGNDIWFISMIAGFFLILYGVLMYVGLTLGSFTWLWTTPLKRTKEVEKKSVVLNESSPHTPQNRPPMTVSPPKTSGGLRF
jgi:hypothetical protein